jgi:glycosyltransferase involved in cell wall biosynthesis
LLRVHVYTMAWNEEQFLPYFLRHYASFAQRIVVLDNQSDDRTADIVRAFPGAILGAYDTGGAMREDIRVRLKNEMWKSSRGQADFVIVVDTDELVWHPRLSDVLQTYQEQGITLARCRGFEMIADQFPDTPGQIYDVVKRGCASTVYDKPCIFDPNAIDEMNFTLGGHGAKPRGGRIVLPESWELYLLHFRMLGLHYFRSRMRVRQTRQPDFHRERKWNVHYEQTDEQFEQWFRDSDAAAMQVVP